ncbi:LysR family transcriptional regulator [Spongorhabdus nitratireducens]
MRSSKEFRGQLGDADLRILRIYRTVVECGGFSAAEVDLNITRSAISIAISSLETRLGFKLCHRGRSGFSLTDEGHDVYEYTLELLSAIENFRTRVNSLHAALKGELNIGITDNLVTIPHMLITHALAQLKETGPDVTVNIRMIPPNDIERAVLSGQLHVGVVPDIRHLSGLEYHHLYKEKSFLYCSDLHPLAGLDEQSARIQTSKQDTVVPAYAQSAAIKTLYQNFKASATATDREGIAFLVLTGKYLGFLPEHFADQWVREKRMFALEADKYHYTTNFSAITSKTARKNLVQDTFMDLLLDKNSR